VLRPSNSLLGSSRPALRANVRAERVKALGQMVRAMKALLLVPFSVAFELLLLWLLPLAYLASSYFALDVPARWLMHRPTWGGWGALLFVSAVAVGLVGLVRAVQGAEPIAPVRPRFAKAMLALSWIAALILTLGDLAS